MMIVYSSASEILITTAEKEPNLLREYFEEGGRDKDDYDREVCDTVIQVESSLNVCTVG